MRPGIIIIGSDRYVQALVGQGAPLREYLLSRGVPCGPVERPGGRYQGFRLGQTANVGAVRALLDRWVADATRVGRPEASPRAPVPSADATGLPERP
jgi:hypothetical protein